MDLDRVRHDGISMIETPAEVEPEIKKMMALGVQAAVEVSTIDLGRDVRKLKQISLDTGLTIVASTGFYLTQYHPEWLKTASAQQIAEVYVRELTEGIEDTGIRAGIIAEIASSPERFEGEEKKPAPAMRWRSWKPAMAIICFSATIYPGGHISQVMAETGI